jgi:hypothetical protein
MEFDSHNYWAELIIDKLHTTIKFTKQESPGNALANKKLKKSIITLTNWNY